MKNSMKTPDQKKRSKQLGKEIRDSRKRYEDLSTGIRSILVGWGANMNLVRITSCTSGSKWRQSWIRKIIRRSILEIPAEVSVHYMTDPDGSGAGQQLHLEVLKKNQDFQYLRSNQRRPGRRNQSVHEPSTLCPGNGRCDPEGRSGGNAKMPGSGILRQIFERKSESWTKS